MNPFIRLTLKFTAIGAVTAIFALGVKHYRLSADLFAPQMPSALLADPGNAHVPGLSEVSFVSTHGDRLAGWYVPSVNRAAIVVCHGTNADRSTMLPEVRSLAAAGFGVLAFDWPGLGRSGGEISWDGRADAALTAAVTWLSHRDDVDPTRIGALGFSMGGVTLTRVAARDARIHAMVLEGTPPDFRSYVAYHHRRWGPLSEWPALWALHGSDLLDPRRSPRALIGAFAPRSVLVIGGTRDEEVPERLVRDLYTAAMPPKSLWIIPGAAHGLYAEAAGMDFDGRLVAFYSESLRAP